MKILIVSTRDIEGGASRAAYRLHRSLLEQKIDSKMLVQSKTGDDFTVHNLGTSHVKKVINILRPIIDSLPLRFYRDREKTTFSASWLGFNSVVDTINEMAPDIVHLHWINDGMIRIEDLARLKAPIVWSLHDNWAFTGGCHIKRDCEKYTQSCGSCPRLVSSRDYDLSRRVYNRKQRAYSRIENMTIVGLSNWMKECSASSSLLGDRRHSLIPNPIDTDIYRPFDKEKSRELWGLPKDKKLILFGAIRGTSDSGKGYSELQQALPKIAREDIELVVFGSSEPEHTQFSGLKTHYKGHLHDDVSLVTLYSAADVFVTPSSQEAFGQTAVEALACGTPVVAYGHTGLLDIVDHTANGYLAKPKDIDDFANGITWVLDNPNYHALCQRARGKAINQFHRVVVAREYLSLYKDVLSNGKR